jgi:hypothetical protein
MSSGNSEPKPVDVLSFFPLKRKYQRKNSRLRLVLSKVSALAQPLPPEPANADSFGY